jgi:branched-subunit amino acid transport protein
VLYPKGDTIDISWHNPSLLAALIAAGVSRVTKNLFATIGVGMVAFLLLRWLLPA